MPWYRVNARVVGSKCLGDFEAATPEEAEEKAVHAKGMVNLCHQCADECQDPEVEVTSVEEIPAAEAEPRRRKK